MVEDLYCGNQDADKEALVETGLLNTTEDAITVINKLLGGQSMPLCCQTGVHLPGARWPAIATATTMSTPGGMGNTMT